MHGNVAVRSISVSDGHWPGQASKPSFVTMLAKLTVVVSTASNTRHEIFLDVLVEALVVVVNHIRMTASDPS